MTIQKRDKRRRQVDKTLAYAPLDKMVDSPVMDRMIRTYPRQCPYCGQGTMSTICKCGRLTTFRK